MTVLLENKYVRENIINFKDKYPEKFRIFIIALKNLEESDDWS